MFYSSNFSLAPTRSMTGIFLWSSLWEPGGASGGKGRLGPQELLPVTLPHAQALGYQLLALGAASAPHELWVSVSTWLSVQSGGYSFALRPQFSKPSKKSCWFLVSCAIFLLLRRGVMISNIFICWIRDQKLHVTLRYPNYLFSCHRLSITSNYPSLNRNP